MIQNPTNLEKLKHYFKMSAFGWFHRKSLNEIQQYVPVSKRRIRNMIEDLKNHGWIIAADQISGGYFLVDENNIHDIEIVRIFVKRQMSNICNQWQSMKVYQELFPIGQMKFGYE